MLDVRCWLVRHPAHGCESTNIQHLTSNIRLLSYGAAAFLLAGSVLFAQVIEGTVVNSVTKLPISGATVSIEAAGKAGYQATTDENGAFRIEGVKDGSYTARFSKSGFLAPARD